MRSHLITKAVIVAAAALLSFAPAALAEGEIGVQGGLLFPDEHVQGETGLIDGLSPTIGVRGLYRFSGSWGVFLDANYSILDTLVTGPSGDAEILAYRLGVEVPLGGRGRGEWFVTGGGGWLDASFDDDATLDFDRALASVSFGQRYETGDRGLWRWEARFDHTIGDDGLGGENVDQAYLLLGYSFRMGSPPADTDGDGVRDGRDKCPDTPRGAIVDEDGCPLDSDGDGVFDGIDKCPDTPQGWPVDASGCPKDSDGDGVPDGRDKCPDTPKGATVDVDGCPSDADGDGVWDGIDKCPDTPKGVAVDEVGCPKQTLFSGTSRTLVLEGVNFALNSANLTIESDTTLDRVAKALVEFPDIRVEVAGHTDSSGSDSYNLGLSQRRADAVKTYLIGKGVAADRLTTKGYGETEPVADNKTEEGRARNRRVELRRLD